MDELVVRPIGVAHTPFTERASAPRQPAAKGGRGVEGTLELFDAPGMEHAVEDLESWTHLWVLFWFHLNEGWRPKVLPPRSTRRRGVLATRSPHRPNPIGISVVELVKVDRLVLHVRNLDLVDGTPIVDVKPYVPYTDAVVGAGEGWLEDDPVLPWEIAWSDAAREQAAWLASAHGVDLREAVERTLSLGPQPHPYRRIRREREGNHLVLAVKEWRARFVVDERARRATVVAILSGYRRPTDAVHVEYCAKFGPAL